MRNMFATHTRPRCLHENQGFYMIQGEWGRGGGGGGVRERELKSKCLFV